MPIIRVSKINLEVFEGEEHKTIKDGIASIESYAWVGFFEQEYIYRHFKTFDTIAKAEALMTKIFNSSGFSYRI